MQPPEDVNTTFSLPASAPAWSRFSVPMMLTFASRSGSETDFRTSTCAARWKMILGFVLLIRSPSAVDVTSTRWKLNFPRRERRASERLWSAPDERSSTPMTSSPSASNRSTRCEPMKPAEPVTMTRKGVPPDRYACVSLTVRLVVGDGLPPRSRPGSHLRTLSQDRSLDDGPRPDHGPRQEDGIPHRRPVLDRRPGAQARTRDRGGLRHRAALSQKHRARARIRDRARGEIPCEGIEVRLQVLP